MASLKIGNVSIGLPEDPIFIIAEIGQNHQGNLLIAKKLIEESKDIVLEESPIDINATSTPKTTLPKLIPKRARKRKIPFNTDANFGNYFEIENKKLKMEEELLHIKKEKLTIKKEKVNSLKRIAELLEEIITKI